MRVCHSNNDKHWDKHITKYSYGSNCCLYDVTWNDFCGTCDDCDFNICGVGTATLICCVCVCPGDDVSKLIWCNVWCCNPVCVNGWVCLKVVSSVDSSLLCGHIHCIQSNVHLDNDVPCGLTLDIGNIGLPHGTLHSV